ncbi:MAG: S-layer protein [Candidatus Berkelbacteria bacterium Athens1014_28]|uniref:S-layer protein n=1 Tax=Candidatus Berkelbacteria bacterium Athens1014_28 TaxID=2017145 RepID=A0A554LQG7_9BACT|nr:MAG: S-layer protein [Candidatus Berkelbacteria bacterium Athens1014_28]
MNIVLIRKREAFASLILLAVLVLPFFSFAGTSKIYVDDSASGTQNGSVHHPYKTITKALEKANDDDEIHIASGTYKENIKISNRVKVFGSGMDKVTIIARDDSKEVVDMHGKSEINGVTIRGGKYGIEVDKDSKASIIECRILDNDKDGISIESGKVNDKYKVSIVESKIEKNGRAGIFSQKRRLVIIDNEIRENESDGIDIEKGSSVWIADNEVKDNEGSGLRVVLDGSEIWTKKNTFYNNHREGIEINAYGQAGRVDINKSKLYKNDRNGIAKIQRGDFPVSIWDGATVQSNNLFWENKLTNVTDAIRVK